MKDHTNGKRFKATDPQTVPGCLCKDGFRADCHYSIESEVNEFFAEKEEEPLDMVK